MRKKATKQQIAVSFGILAVVALAVFWWWPHIYWSVQLSRNQLKIPKVPVTDLKAPDQTSGWYDCRIGPVSFKIPPHLAENAERTSTKTSINFITPEQELTIHIPFRISAGSIAEQGKLAAEMKLSPMKLLAQAYSAGTDDFRWTMSRDELRKHQLFLRLASYYRITPFPMHVETRFGETVEGILVIGDRRQAIYTWQTRAAGGSIGFAQKDKDLDLDWVRDLCQSFDCDESRLGSQPYSKQEMNAFLENVEIQRDGKGVEAKPAVEDK